MRKRERWAIRKTDAGKYYGVFVNLHGDELATTTEFDYFAAAQRCVDIIIHARVAVVDETKDVHD